jgi:predicted kinase
VGVPLVTLLCGPAGAGKTTHASRLERGGAVRLSMDRAQWEDGWRGEQAPAARLAELHAGLQVRLQEVVAAGRDVVVDLSLATRAIRDEWRSLARAAGARTELVVMTAPFPVLLERVRARSGRDHADAVVVPDSQLRRYVEGFEWPTPDESPRVIVTG